MNIFTLLNIKISYFMSDFKGFLQFIPPQKFNKGTYMFLKSGIDRGVFLILILLKLNFQISIN